MWWIDAALCGLVSAASWVLQLLPWDAALWLGRRFGDAACLVARKRARIGYANLTCAFGDRYTPPERWRIIRRAFENLGQGAVEMLCLPVMDRAYVKEYITINHFDRIASALQGGHGLIFLTGHFGNWELSSIVGGLVGYPVTALARIQKFPRLYRLLTRMREAKGCRIVAKGMAMRDLIKTLRDGQIVGIVADQDAKEHGEYLPLLGRPASVAKGPMQLALETGAVVLPTFIYRTRGAHHVIDLEAPVEVPAEADEAARLRAGLGQFVAHLERHVTDHPDQWLWMHKRWKSTPARAVLILDDGKVGHRRQSEWVARQYTQLAEARGKQVRTQTIAITWRQPWRKWAATLAAWWPLGTAGMRLLRWALERDSSAALSRAYADVVISTGSAAALANALFAPTVLAKSVVVMWPSSLPLSRWGLALIPAHDQPPARPNIVVTTGALSHFDETALQAGLAALRRHAQPHAGSADWLSEQRLRIGVLLGGPTPKATLEASTVERLLAGLSAVAERCDGSLFVTTSRRTPAALDRLIETRLGQDRRCPVLVLPNRVYVNGAVEGIIGSAQILVVSGESISMVSEAAGSGRPVIVLAPSSLRSARHRRFLKHLAREEYIHLVDVGEVAPTIERLWRAHQRPRRLDDTERLKAALARLI